MAEENKGSSYTNLRTVKTNINVIGMNKDIDPQLLKEGEYTHAINAKLNNLNGDAPFITNEPSTELCNTLILPFISSSQISNNRSVVFTGDGVSSEIGVFDEQTCTYETILNANCLNFSKEFPIKAISQIINNCDEVIYFVDNNNPNRYLNFNDIPHITIPGDDDCKTPQETDEIDCEQLRLNSLIDIPCLTTSLSEIGGKLTNGAYQVAIAYSENSIRITDIHSITNPVSIFTHQNFGGGISVDVSNIDKDYDQYIIYLLATVKSGTTVYEIGVFNTSTTSLEIDNINEKPTLPLGDVFLQSIIYEKSKDIVTVEDRALWVGATTKTRINYQPQANNIKVRWVARAVPEEYYRDGGNKVGYMRDEVYPLGVRWIYNTGDKTEAFHIPGPEARSKDLVKIYNSDAYEAYDPGCDDTDTIESWKIYNTAIGSTPAVLTDKCDDIDIAIGDTGFWQSTELYPDNEELYGDLACTPIRHHRMPDLCKVPYKISNSRVILGMRLERIAHPVDCDGNEIEGIVGYEIVRGDRTNHRSIQGKGLLYNMAEYDSLTAANNKVLYPNYPFNDLRQDNFLSKTETKGKGTGESFNAFTNQYKKDLFTFHSPSFAGFEARQTFGTDLVIEGEMYGSCATTFDEVHNHPRSVLLTNLAFVASLLFGISTGVSQANDEDGGILDFLNDLLGVLTGNVSSGIEILLDKISKPAKIAIYTFLNTRLALDTIQNFAKPRSFAYQVNALGTYDTFRCYTKSNRRRRISEVKYIYPQVQRFNDQLLNNWKRESGVAISITRKIDDPITLDTSRQTMGQADACENKSFTSTVSSHYASIRRKLPAQYGQIDSIHYLNTGYCDNNIPKATSYTSDTFFGGDTYLNRFSLKRKLQYFTQTAVTTPSVDLEQNINNYEFDYREYMNIPYVRYWIDSFRYDPADIISFDGDGDLNLPSEQHNLDCNLRDADGDLQMSELFNGGIFTKKPGYMYVSNNGVVDFIVESEYNLDLRDWDNRPGKRHFDRNEHTDLKNIFRQDFADIDNDHKYDLSYSKQLTENFIQPQSITYSCDREVECFSAFPNRVFWSLPYFEGATKDTWRSYLANNSFDFPKEAGNLIATKPLTRDNLVFLFDDSSPWMIIARDTLKVADGGKVAVGDGGFFSQTPRPLITTDVNYGATQHSALTNTQFGLLYISARQGRVFLMQGTNIIDVSRNKMQWWFKENLPLKLIETYADYQFQDNIVAGIGFDSVFDNVDEIFHLIKKDYKPLDSVLEFISYDSDTNTFTDTRINEVITLQDSAYFEDCSWTVSYSPKDKAWISFHDWHPEATIQTERRPISVKDKGIYKHDSTCEHYCYFYDTQHPFDIEYVINHGQQTSTLSNLEYSIECYTYDKNCNDRHHLLDYNFNRAFIYNTEQMTGMLYLNTSAKNQISKIRQYPIIELNHIEIDYSKIEQKYRFNKFWDVTKNRAEFNTDFISTTITKCNGYNYELNPEYIDYNKPIYQRKKLRHNWHKVYLRREDEDKEMNQIIVKFLNNKNIISPH